MRKLILCILFAISFLNAWAQEPGHSARISALEQDAEDAKRAKDFAKAADIFTEIATLYATTSPSKAEENYNEAFSLSKNPYDKMVLKNLIGSLYEDKKDFQAAAKFYTEALIYAKETGNEENYTLNTYLSVGDMYKKAEQYRTAVSYFTEGLKISVEYKNQKKTTYALKEIADCYSRNGEIRNADKYKSLFSANFEKIEKELFGKTSTTENKTEMLNLRKIISQIDDENRGLKDSLLMQISDIEQLQNAIQSLSDTLNAQQQNLAVVQKNLTDKTHQLTKLENYLQERNVAFTVAISIIAIITALSILTFRGYYIKRKQNKLLAEQKKIIDAKNEDMTASVRYAERIQKALFSPITSLNKIFPESFIILKPRDIVSGDFYWFSEIGNKIVVAAADCTGHGIPGAFMSVLGISFFDEIVNKSHITESDQIINKLRNNIVKSFHVTDEAGQAKDGMDLTLVVIDKQKMTLQFSGAYNPLLIMRDGEAIVHKADRMPVGFHDKYHTPFTKHEFELKKGDLLYMFSDGFLDQFGGLHGKKFLFKRLQEVLQKICYKSMEDQRDILESAFKQWKGKYDQVDDVLLMGIRI